MSTTQLADIIEPAVFTDYIIQNTMEQTRLYQSGIIAANAVMQAQLKAGAHSFTVPFWRDLGNEEANITNDDPNDRAIPHKLGSGKQVVRKSFLHNSWSAMNLASEIAGSDALNRIQSRVTAYWDRQMQRRLIASLNGIKAANVANDGSDMVVNISGGTGNAAKFSANAVIDAAGTLGDQLNAVVAIGMHSDKYRDALKNDMIETIPDSKGGSIQTFRGLGIVVDDGLPVVDGNYTSVLFGMGAFGYAVTAPNYAQGTEIENLPSAGRGAGQQILHSRVNIAMHPSGFSWLEGEVEGESPTIAELADPLHWQRILERKAVQLAFLVTK